MGTETPKKTLPTGIIQMPNGRYRVRALRSKTWYNGGVHEELSDAIQALTELIERLGPRTFRKPKPRDTHYKQLIAAPLGVSMRNISYSVIGGYRVSLTRNDTIVYFGNFPDLESAIKCRDEAEKTYRSAKSDIRAKKYKNGAPNKAKIIPLKIL